MTEYVLYEAAGSPAVRRVKMWFAEKGLAYRGRLLDLGRMEQKSPRYLALNPSGTVPALQAGDEVVYDSHVILRYLERRHPQAPRLLPEFDDLAFERWVCLERDMAQAMRPAVYETFAKQRARRVLEEDPGAAEAIRRTAGEEAWARSFERLCRAPADELAVELAKLALRPMLVRIESVLGDGREWLLGDEFSLADLSVATRLAVLPYIGVEIEPGGLPAVAAYLQRFCARPSWEATAAAEPAERFRP